jgi:hypothetical protein
MKYFFLTLILLIFSAPAYAGSYNSNIGDDLKELVSFGSDKIWHLDVKNSKIRIIDNNMSTVGVANVDW